MSERTSKKPGIAGYVAARRKHKDCFLDEINRLIDWKPIEKVLRQKLKRVVNAVGNPAYPPLLMAIKRKACGYRNRDHFKTAIYFFCGGLGLYPVSS